MSTQKKGTHRYTGGRHVATSPLRENIPSAIEFRQRLRVGKHALEIARITMQKWWNF